MTEGSKADRLRSGWWVFLGLAALTGIEFFISSAIPSPVPYLTVTAVIKAGLIARFFMHVPQLWKRKGAPE